MNSVQRTKGIRKIIQVVILGKSMPKYVAAGNWACGRMMREARSRRQQKPDPSDEAILAWAKFDLSREIMGGFWQVRVA